MKHNRIAIRTSIMILLVIMILGFVCTAHAEPAITAELPIVKGTEEGGLSETEAAEGYINQAFGLTGEPVRLRSASLSGKNAVILAALTDMAHEVAAGQVSSTVCEIPVNSFLTKTRYTAEDLGVSTLVAGSSIAQDAKEAFYAEVASGIDMAQIIHALKANLPYEMYWFSNQYSYGFPDITSNGQEIWFKDEDQACYKVLMQVSENYSVGGLTETCAYDTSFGTRVQTAVTNAQAILTANAGKTDEEKLTAYKQAICNAVTYDTAAVNPGKPYGDPWQMVSVFDGDDDTNVVCEGYSKAFQYLCDQSSFTGNVSAISVTGNMSGGTGEGPHMWNIVTLNDGKNYMADITNSDNGTVGAGGGLFLSGYTTKNSDSQYIYVIDENNSVTYTYDEETVSLFGNSGKLAMEGEEDNPSGYDTTAPKLNSVTISPAEVAVDGSLEIDLDITETETGVMFVQIMYMAPEDAGDQFLYTEYYDSPVFSGTQTFYVPITDEFDPGNYIIDDIRLSDYAGNSVHYGYVEDRDLLVAMSDGNFTPIGDGSDTATINGGFTVTADEIPDEEFVQPNVSIKSQYEPDEEILISVPWVEGATRLSIAIQGEHGDSPYAWGNCFWSLTDKPADGICEFLINVVQDEQDRKMVEGEYVAVITLEGTGYQTASYKYRFEITDSTYPALTLEAPETLPIGREDLAVKVSGKAEDAYVTAELYRVTGEGEPERLAPYYTYDEESDCLHIDQSAFETAGTYEIRMYQRSWRRWGEKKSEPAAARVTVTGSRPAAPTVFMPADTVNSGETLWIRVSAAGAEAVSYETSDWDTDEYLAQNGTVLVPFRMDTWYDTEVQIAFRAKVNGTWSARTAYYTITNKEKQTIPGPGMTVPETSPQGQDITIRNITSVPGAGLYTFSVGLYNEDESYPEYDYISTDQIIYNEPFDPTDGTLVIPGCNFMDPGTYCITITAYRGGEGDFLSETNKFVVITENGAIPDAPAVTLLTTEHQMYGKTRFRVVTTEGADRIYAFVKRADDYGLDINPVFIETDPEDEDSTYEFDWTNRNHGNFEARFAVYKDGVWSETSEAITFTVPYPDADRELDSVVITGYPQEAVIGEQMTIGWAPVEHAEWYEVRINLNNVRVLTAIVPADEVPSYTVDTTKLLQVSGEYLVRVVAFAEGYYEGRSDNLWITLLDPNLKIKAELQSVSNGVANLGLTGVCADRLRVRINGEDRGMIAVGSGKNCSSISVYVGNQLSTVQVANYGIRSDEWGTWSEPVYVLDTAKILTLPANLTEIEAGAFEGIDCEAVIIPDGCTTIGAGAFRNCRNLKLISYPSGTIIGDGAFEGCSEELTIIER